MLPPWQGCPQGHLLCTACPLPPTWNCPACNTPYPNKARMPLPMLEHAYRLVPPPAGLFPCPHAECTERVVLDALAAHAQRCVHGRMHYCVHCPNTTMRPMTRDALWDHYTSAHAAIVDDVVLTPEQISVILTGGPRTTTVLGNQSVTMGRITRIVAAGPGLTLRIVIHLLSAVHVRAPGPTAAVYVQFLACEAPTFSTPRMIRVMLGRCSMLVYSRLSTTPDALGWRVAYRTGIDSTSTEKMNVTLEVCPVDTLKRSAAVLDIAEEAEVVEK